MNLWNDDYVNWSKIFPKAEEKAEDPEVCEAFTKGVVHTTKDEVRNYPQVSILKAKVADGKIYLDVDSREKWSPIEGDIVGELLTILLRDGKWHYGPSDGVHQFPSVKNMDSACVPEGDARLYEPKPGEAVGLKVIGCCRRGRFMRPKQVTSTVWITWPGGN